MSGHSQFKNIMHRKGAQDARKGKIFNKIAREIMVAAKCGMPDPASNTRLRTAIAVAREANMPRDRIDRAIKAGSPGGEDSAVYENIRYEGYGPGGVAIIVEALTENRNRTAAEVRATFGKRGGAMGEMGSVAFMFDRIGTIFYPAGKVSFDDLFEVAVEAGADNVEETEDGLEVTTAPESFHAVRDVLVAKFGEPESSSIGWRPNITATPNEEQAETLMGLIETLEENDDVQNVFGNYDIPDDVMQRIADKAK
ncbi:MAG TPA: YebC/PmpR family DNA-binding transcriptional regulator [Rhodospirillaceae bacterium]|nr:MAG: transcriptional regulator [Alphaproteobacteria bacterium GWF2_58_20]HAU29062.1 YebC/PmpR family DNA-binding transcriptional regulator [Rhodospirillaceae bacterium]